jgi:predicted HNH restriction endonuclease
MRELEFTAYLIARYPNKPGSWKTYRSETKRIAKYKGDLDILYANDEFEALLASFEYSKKDGILPTDNIPHKARNPFEPASFRRQCINQYINFCRESPPDCMHNNPDEVSADDVFWEGAVRSILVDQYERDRQARTACIDYYGAHCIVCNLDFESVYGTIGKNYIHVHHLRQISEIKEYYQIDPIADLRPVCPNCHAVIHKRTPPYTVDEMKNIVRQFGKFPDSTRL